MTSPSPRPILLNTGILSTGLRRILNSRIAATLATPHGVDRYLEQFNPTWSLHEVRAEVTAVRHGTADSVTLTLRPNGNWQWRYSPEMLTDAVQGRIRQLTILYGRAPEVSVG